MKLKSLLKIMPYYTHFNLCIADNEDVWTLYRDDTTRREIETEEKELLDYVVCELSHPVGDERFCIVLDDKNDDIN